MPILRSLFMSDDPRVRQASRPAAEALRLHPFYRGKVQVLPKCPINGLGDFAVWYTPGVAATCQAIAADPDTSYEHTNRANSIAVVSDGTRILGLGNIGPLAGMPVMEGKSLLFKYLGGVDAIPLCVATRSADELIDLVKALEPSFGGINLEDIAQPKCFRVLDTLRTEMEIPVWHDDQQGSATVVLAGLLNALQVVGKQLGNVRIALVGVGAANVATYRLLSASGVSPAAIVACDTQGVLHPGRVDLERNQLEYRDKWRICQDTNADQIRGGVADALRGADVCLAFSASGPDVIRPEWIRRMARDAIVFACANPVPEIWPWSALEAGAPIVASGRSDFPNQVNNSLAFPGIFRGTLDVRARTITDEMALAAANELAAYTAETGLSPQRIVPRMDEWPLYSRVAAATALAAQRQNVARLNASLEAVRQSAARTIAAAQEATRLLMEHQLIPRPPAP
jgi:malate dehydrogenase (oxaloacetate-decarboxylating)